MSEILTAEQITARSAELNARAARLTAEQNRVRARAEVHMERLSRVRERAKELYGTDDVEKLREIERNNRIKNTQELAEFEAKLIELEQNVKAATAIVDEVSRHERAL